MTLKRLAKRLAPPLLVDMVRALRGTPAASPFRGVYRRWDEVPKVGAQFQDESWARMAADHSRSLIATNEAAFIPAAVAGESSLLPLLAAMNPGLSVLDYGGATGFAYLAAKYGSMRPIGRFVVVEHAKVCEAGRAMLSGVEFVEQIPAGHFDLVLIGASLQYAPDYAGLLTRLSAGKPRWFLFTKLPAGENVTFVTMQVNLPGKEHAHWLFNVRDIVALMDGLGYDLIFRGAVQHEINQDGFEPQYRVQRCCNLLFESKRPPGSAAGSNVSVNAAVTS